MSDKISVFDSVVAVARVYRDFAAVVENIIVILVRRYRHGATAAILSVHNEINCRICSRSFGLVVSFQNPVVNCIVANTRVYGDS